MSRRSLTEIEAAMAARIGNTDGLHTASRIPRYVAQRTWFCREAVREGYSTVAVGRYINRDHSTVIAALHRYERECETWRELKAIIHRMEEPLPESYH